MTHRSSNQPATRAPASTGQHMRQVLVTSLIAAILLLIVIAAVQFS